MAGEPGFEPFLQVRQTHDPKDETSGETARSIGNTRARRIENTGRNWKNGTFSGNFPRRYYPDRVQRVSLSLAARRSCRHRMRSTPVSSIAIKAQKTKPPQTGDSRAFFVGCGTLAQCRQHGLRPASTRRPRTGLLSRS